MPIRRFHTGLVLVLAVSLTTAADSPAAQMSIDVGAGTVVEHLDFNGATEIDYDGERYAYVGQFNGTFKRASVGEGQEGGLRIIDLEGDSETPRFSEVGYLECPGTDNYIRFLDPAVFSPTDGRKFVAMAHHGNLCTAEALADDPHTSAGYGASNGVALIDVTDPTDPTIIDVVGHWSAHTVMPHPTEPYLYILPGGLANGTTAGERVSPTGIVEVGEDGALSYVRGFEHNITGCHDLGFTADGKHAYCAGAGEIQVWSTADADDPEVVGTIVNPAIMFPHNAVISPDGTKLVINDEAFGFHTCSGESADLYGSLWIYDISIRDVPVLAGRISPPKHPTRDYGTYNGWVNSWCAAHNDNFVPGTDIVVASWFAGGMTAHDISDPLDPELVAAYQSEAADAEGDPSVMWSAHYFGGYVLTGDMGKGVEILDIPALRTAEAATVAGETVAAEGGSLLASGTAVTAPCIDRTAELVPAQLPPRPERPAYTDGEGGFCVIPGIGH